MKVRYLVEIDKDQNHVLDMQADCQDIEDALAVRFHRLKGQVNAKPETFFEDIELLKHMDLLSFAKEGVEFLRTFKLYENALEGMGHFEVVHKVGVQGLTVSAIRFAAEFYRKCAAIVDSETKMVKLIDDAANDTAPRQP